jgi:hypothetical protein
MGHSNQPSSGGSPESVRAGHELTDVKAAPLLQFAAMLVVIVALTMWGTFKMFDGMEYVFAERTPISHPMQSIGSAPSGPLLQVDERKDYQAFERKELGQINGDTAYGWVDRPAGIVRVPLEIATELVLRQGLPYRASDK